METTRKRLTVDHPWSGQHITLWNGAEVSRGNYSGRIRADQTTTSEGHPVSRLGDYDSRTGRYEDVGGNFTTALEEYIPRNTGPYNLRRVMGGFTYTYGGPLMANANSNSTAWNPGNWFSSLGPSTDDRLAGLGSTAIARTIPTNSVADLSTFIGELREGLPSLVGSQLLKNPRVHKNLGGEYINWQFGIMPIISDFQKFAKAYKSADKILRQLQRDSGKIVRRRYSFPDEKTVIEDSLTPGRYPMPAAPSYLFDGAGVLKVHTTLTRKSWFSGAYTYYLPKEDNLLGKFGMFNAEANKLLGTRVTPEVFWNLAPWSWAVDWFSNTGDVLHNLSAFANDGLLLRWGYIMETTIVESRFEWDGGVWIGNAVHPIHLSETFRKTWKVRRQATPFGFHAGWDGLSARQLAIAAALGISRGR